MKTNKLNKIMKNADYGFIKMIMVVLALIIGASVANAALTVSNVTAEQKNGKIEISYDLADAAAPGVNIAVKISTNAVDSFTLDPSTLSGDAGNEITTGNGKKITWESTADWPTGITYNAKFEVIAFDGKATADSDIILKPVGIGILGGKVTAVLEWDLQSFTSVDGLQYTPFYCKDTEVTAAQYCRFLNAYKARFSDKSNPSCAVTSVFNNAQGGAWVDAQAANQLCTIRTTPNTIYNNAYSKIKWDAGSSSYQLNVTDWHTNQPMTEVSWFGAVAYCQWLNEEEYGSDTNKWKYRLPTEWEYEFMMGAKTIVSTSNGMRDWGSASWTYGTQHDTISHTHNVNDWVNYFQDGIYGLHGVGTKPGANQSKGYGQNATNVFECYEMSGNVWNWCLDYLGASSGDVSGKDYVYRTLGAKRSLRGGSWNGGASDCMPSHSGSGSDPVICNNRIGIRVIRSR